MTLLARLRALEVLTRPEHPDLTAALAARWDELPAGVKTRNQMLGRRTAGCEGTHGVFPRCDLACTPCYHSKEANRVRVDGEAASLNQSLEYAGRVADFLEFAELMCMDAIERDESAVFAQARQDETAVSAATEGAIDGCRERLRQARLAHPGCVFEQHVTFGDE